MIKEHNVSKCPGFLDSWRKQPQMALRDVPPEERLDITLQPLPWARGAPRRDGRHPGDPQSIDVGVFAHVR